MHCVGHVLRYTCRFFRGLPVFLNRAICYPLNHLHDCWGCGYSDDTPGHQHIVSGDSWTGERDSRWYPLYSATGSTKTAEGYYWEESRWVDTTYKTVDRPVAKTVYHYYRMVQEYESGWETDKPPAKDGREIEKKKQHHYMITE